LWPRYLYPSETAGRQASLRLGRNYKHFTGSSETWGHLLGRRCWENKGDDIDKAINQQRQRSVSVEDVADSRFDKPEHVPVEAGHIDDEFEFKGARCLVEPPIRKSPRRAIGPAVDIVPAEIPHAPNSREAMADVMLRIPSREKSTPFACAWNAKAAQGGDSLPLAMNADRG
jgi:hypothetical protein